MKATGTERKMVRKSFRMELVGAGMYESLAKQYRQHEQIGQKFLRFSGHESMHSRLFDEYHRKNYGDRLGGTRVWRGLGKITAIAMHPLSLEKKVKKICAIEHQAVHTIETLLARERDCGLYKIMKRILPDEIEHASLYGEIFLVHENRNDA